MCRSALAALSLSALMTVAACQTEDPSAPAGNDARPVNALPLNADLACRFSPSGTVVIPVGQIGNFSESAGNCTGAYGVLSPQDGRLGFGISTPCATFEATAVTGFTTRFKVRRCVAGNGTLRIYTNSNKTTLLQTITLETFF